MNKSSRIKKQYTLEFLFAKYCIKKINKAIAKKKNDTEILFSESEEMCQLQYDEINWVYKSIKSRYFNDYSISINFGGYDLGSSVSIYYLKDGLFNCYIKTFKDKYEEYIEKCDILLSRCKESIKEAKDTDFRLKVDVSKLCLYAHMWDYMYLDISQKLQEMGWTLKKELGTAYLYKVLI